MCNPNYNKEQIESIWELFKSKKLKPEDITIYLDMDNTLCIFSHYGDDDDALKKARRKGYYRNLPCFHEAPSTVETLQKIGFKVKIISACIDTKYCREEKREWIRFHLPTMKDEDIILIDNGLNKTDFVENIEFAILIDDYHKNLIDWMNKGGLAIKKTYSGKKRPIPQVSNLIEIFEILYSLNIFKN